MWFLSHLLFMSQFNIWTNWILNPSRPRCSVSEPYMRMKTVTQSFPPNIFWGEAARLVWTWWASELVCVTWVADTSSCWSILIWVAPPGEERATEHTFSNYPRFAGPAFQRGAVCEVGGWRQAVNSSYCANDFLLQYKYKNIRRIVTTHDLAHECKYFL